MVTTTARYYLGPLVAAMTTHAATALAGPCGPNAGLGGYYIDADGQRISCSSTATGNLLEFVASIFGWFYGLAEAFGGGTTIVGALIAVVAGIFITGSQKVRVKTYRNNVLIRDEIQGGVQAMATGRTMRLIGSLLKIFGMIMFVMGTFVFADGLHF